MTRPTCLLVLALTLVLLWPATGSAQGLELSDQARRSWPARLVVGAAWDHPRGAVASWLNDLWVPGGVPLGRDGDPLGLRASGGMVLGAGSAALAVAAVGGPAPLRPDGLRSGMGATAPGSADRIDAHQAQPYLGLGYTHRTTDGAWNLSADLGMVAATETGLSWGRTLLDANRLDDAMRNLRLRPVVQLGARYRF